MTEPTITRVAVVQAAPIAFDRDRTIEKVRALTAEARAKGAGLVLLPEAFVSAYPRGAAFGAVVGARTDAGRDLFRRYWESSVDVPGPAVDALGRIAHENQVYLVIGVIERAGGTLYCTVLFFDPGGALMGKHRKLMPTASERLVWGQGDGSTMPVFDTPIGKVGAVICWENYMPLLRTTMYAKGIEIYCAPTADGRESWLASMRHIACEGRCFVLSCNQYALRSDYPDDYDTSFDNDPATVYSRGGSCIVSPLGELVRLVRLVRLVQGYGDIPGFESRGAAPENCSGYRAAPWTIGIADELGRGHFRAASHGMLQIGDVLAIGLTKNDELCASHSGHSHHARTANQ